MSSYASTNKKAMKLDRRFMVLKEFENFDPQWLHSEKFVERPERCEKHSYCFLPTS